MTLIREANDLWQIEQPSPFPAPLAAGLKIVVSGELLKRKADVPCVLKDWVYRADDAELGRLELTVEEIRQSRIDRWYSNLNSDTQFMVGGAIPVTLMLVLAAVAFITYSQPDHVAQWAFLGRHIRGVVGWGLVIVFGMILPWRLGLLNGPPKLSHTFLSFSLSVSGLLLALLWLHVATFPESFTGSQAEYASFAQGLAARFSRSYWPYVLAALPWISLGFKALGMSFAQGATDIFAKSRKS
jgi:hypothetical protein